MASKDPFANPDADKELPPTPHTPFEVDHQRNLRSSTPCDPFLDSVTPPSRSQSLSEASLSALPFGRMGSRREGQGLPREETFRTTTESLAGRTASAGSSDYDNENGFESRDDLSRTPNNFYGQGDHNGATHGYSQFDFGMTEGDLQGASQYMENDLRGLSEGFDDSNDDGAHLQSGLQFSDVDLHTPNHELRQIAYDNGDQPSADAETAPTHKNDNAEIPSSPSQPGSSSTLQGTYRSQSLTGRNPFNDQLHAHFSSPAAVITPMRVLPKADYTPSRLGIHPAFRQAGAGYTAHGNASTSSLNREVRLREAAKQQDILLNQERVNDEKARTPIHAAPTLRPSPIALKTAAQLIRDSPAGKLPIGPQAVLCSKAFWSGLVLLQIGLISMVAAITRIVSEGDIYADSPIMGGGNTAWLIISIIVLLAGIILAAIVYLRKMGHWVDAQQLRKLERVGLVDRLMGRSPPRKTEEGHLDTSDRTMMTMASVSTMPRPRQGLYAAQARFTFETFNSINPYWHELYMTPEQLRQKISVESINASTPSRTGSGPRGTNRHVSLGTSILSPNQASSSPMSPDQSQQLGSSSPFSPLPRPRTPFFPKPSGFSPPSAEQKMTNNTQPTPASRENALSEPLNWSPLELLERDINSEHVRNLSTPYRRPYFVEQRKISVDRSRLIREGITASMSSTSISLPSSSTTGSPDHLHPSIPITRRDSAAYEVQKGKMVSEEGEEIEMTEMMVRNAEMPEKVEKEGEGEGIGKKEMIKKMINKGKTGFKELDGRSVGKGVRERIERLKEQSERAQMHLHGGKKMV